MESDKISANDKPPLYTSSSSPLHIKRVLNAKRQYSESILRVKMSGAEMYNIYRAFHGRLNISYRQLEDSEKGSFYLNFHF
uniref:PB1 domain-containing protein n=1 Tax=Elaeophora elaphi TaxID=1147741 RepID=A0A0R3RNK2_9BILA